MTSVGYPPKVQLSCTVLIAMQYYTSPLDGFINSVNVRILNHFNVYNLILQYLTGFQIIPAQRPKLMINLLCKYYSYYSYTIPLCLQRGDSRAV